MGAVHRHAADARKQHEGAPEVTTRYALASAGGRTVQGANSAAPAYAAAVRNATASAGP